MEVLSPRSYSRICDPPALGGSASLEGLGVPCRSLRIQKAERRGEWDPEEVSGSTVMHASFSHCHAAAAHCSEAGPHRTAAGRRSGV